MSFIQSLNTGVLPSTSCDDACKRVCPSLRPLLSIGHTFLDGFSHLYKQVCPSIGLLDPSHFRKNRQKPLFSAGTIINHEDCVCVCVDACIVVPLGTCFKCSQSTQNWELCFGSIFGSISNAFLHYCMKLGGSVHIQAQVEWMMQGCWKNWIGIESIGQLLALFMMNYMILSMQTRLISELSSIVSEMTTSVCNIFTISSRIQDKNEKRFSSEESFFPRGNKGRFSSRIPPRIPCSCHLYSFTWWFETQKRE